jgi:hypothetical protein
MFSRNALLVAVCMLFVVAGDRRAAAGGIHIRYGPDAPERMAAANVRYEEGVLNLYHHHPLEFAANHPFYTRMFNDEAMIDKLLLRWESHEQRFEYWHDCLWKVLDGYRASHHGVLPTIPVTAGSPGSPGEGGAGLVGGGAGIPGSVGPGGNNPATSPGGNGDGGGTGTLSVPEPSSGVLMVLGLTLAVLWFACRHFAVGFLITRRSLKLQVRRHVSA